MTTDKEIVQAECRIRLRIDPDGVINLIGLLKGKRALATWDLSEEYGFLDLDRTQPHWQRNYEEATRPAD